MTNHQDKYIVGYVTIKIKGRHPENFFQYCAKHGIAIWNMVKEKEHICLGTIYLYDLKTVKQIAQDLDFEVIVENPKGFRPGLNRLWARKEILLTFSLCMILLFVLSNMAWKINVTGVSSEIDRKIKEELKDEGLYEGAWVFNLEDLNNIQHQLLHNIPELLYIGIEKKGTIYQVDAIEKSIEKEKEQPSLQHLIAKKDGVIEKIFIKNGLSKVNVNDVVKKGDILVSGLIETEDETDSDETEDIKKEVLVPAEGKIYANTWYELSVTSSLHATYEDLSGQKHTKYGFQIKDINVPIWGFNNPYKHYITEKEVFDLNLFSYTLPIAFVRESHYDMNTMNKIRTKKEIKQDAINYAIKDLKLKFGADTEILSYKVLHESEENGKVKFNLYISVLEDIAIEKKLD